MDGFRDRAEDHRRGLALQTLEVTWRPCPRGAGDDPTPKQMMFLRADLEPLAPFVVDSQRRFQDDKTLVDGPRVDSRPTPRGRRSNERGVVHLEVVAEQGKTKPTPSLERTVASAAIASQPTKQRHHVFLKIGCLADIRAGETLTRGSQGLSAGGVCEQHPKHA